MDEQLSELLRKISKYVFIGVVAVLVLILLLAIFRISIGFWLWSTVETWATVRLGLDYDAAQLVTVILVLVITLLLPTLAWFFLWGKKRLLATGIVIGGQILIFILVSTLGSNVCFDRTTGQPLCYYADIPGKGRVFSRTPGFDPVISIEYKLYTREVALESGIKPNTTTVVTTPENGEPTTPEGWKEVARSEVNVKKPFTEIGSFSGKILVQMWGKAIIDSTQAPLSPKGEIKNKRADYSFPLPNAALFCSILRANGKIMYVGEENDFTFSEKTAVSLGVNDDQPNDRGLGFSDNSGVWYYKISVPTSSKR